MSKKNAIESIKQVVDVNMGGMWSEGSNGVRAETVPIFKGIQKSSRSKAHLETSECGQMNALETSGKNGK